LRESPRSDPGRDAGTSQRVRKMPRMVGKNLWQHAGSSERVDSIRQPLGISIGLGQTGTHRRATHPMAQIEVLNFDRFHHIHP
jgi:hypothetical protein